ncbi:hypothetical protein IU418_26300 [Nocardia farcinica]|uniref:hypothetical protein n=1 Tax=Nocardia farcinica TaxID=37329 RepID=UPI001B3C4ECC|nr:hypothetical protein [Nocardia farcinica]MBF6540722.1 hypothetical protein [Nocardia farcinica]
MYCSLRVPLLRWWLSIQTHYPDPDGEPRWGHARGRCREHVWLMPLGLWDITLHGRAQPYWKLVGFERKPSVDWMLDEYDSTFNEFAAASLRYHLDFACTDNESRRGLYEDLIARLTEPFEPFTPEELTELRESSRPAGGDFIPLEPGNPKAGYRMRDFSDREREIFEISRQRELEWKARNDQARHDFVNIMRHLWS